MELSDEQRKQLEKISSTGRYPARQIKRAQILLKSDQKTNWSYRQISDAFDVSEVTIAKVRKVFKEQGLETHSTPKHGSWLNMAEIELSALTRQCLDRRIPGQQTLDIEVQAWTKERNEKVVKVDWQFTTADARVNLKHLYPKIQP